MSKSEILQELPRLSVPDRLEILDILWQLEESDVLAEEQPSLEEKARLDEALDAYARNSGAGRPWRDILVDLRKRKAS